MHRHFYPRPFAIVLVALFGLAMGAPGLSLLHSVFSIQERARHFPMQGPLDIGLPKAMRGHFRLQAAYDRLRYHIFGIMPRALLVGLHGDLYYDSDAVQDSSTVADWRGKKRYTPGQIAQARQVLNARQKLADSLGFVYLAALAPNKTSAYPYHLPDSLRGGQAQTCWQATRPLLAGVLRTPILELWPSVMDSSRPAFYKTDTHWNDEGALDAYFILARALGWTPIDTTGWTRDSVDYVGDLLRMANLEHSVHERTMRIHPNIVGKALNPEGKPVLHPHWDFPEVSRFFDKDQMGRGATSHTTNATVPIKAVVFHDCYMSFLQPYLAEHLGSVSWVWGPFDEELVKRERPQVVLELRAERYLSLLLDL